MKRKIDNNRPAPTGKLPWRMMLGIVLLCCMTSVKSFGQVAATTYEGVQEQIAYIEKDMHWIDDQMATNPSQALVDQLDADKVQLLTLQNLLDHMVQGFAQNGGATTPAQVSALRAYLMAQEAANNQAASNQGTAPQVIEMRVPQ